MTNASPPHSSSRVVFSLLGADRTGLVDRVTRVLSQIGANMEDSRMAVLGGEFAMMVLCSVTQERSQEMQTQLAALAEELDLGFTFKPTSARRSQAGTLPLEVSVNGADHEGIVQDLVRHLVEQGVSVENLESELVNAPYSGVPLFAMKMRIAAPASLSLSGLRRSLQAVGDNLNVDVEVEPIRGGS